jgi:hypothetical protein
MGCKSRRTQIGKWSSERKFLRRHMRKKMVLCLTWYAKEMEPKRNYLNCARKYLEKDTMLEVPI